MDYPTSNISTNRGSKSASGSPQGVSIDEATNGVILIFRDDPASHSAVGDAICRWMAAKIGVGCEIEENRMIITSAQVREARKLLSLTLTGLAAQSGVDAKHLDAF